MKSPNKRVQRTLHKVLGPLTPDVQHEKMGAHTEHRENNAQRRMAMKRALYMMAVGVISALFLTPLSGCEDDSGSGGARPADISGKWVGFQTSRVSKYPTEMTLTQKGSSVYGTYVQGRSSYTMGQKPDYRWDVSGTYDSSTGIFICDGRWTITFIDDNTMTWSEGGVAGTEKQTTTLHRQ